MFVGYLDRWSRFDLCPRLRLVVETVRYCLSFLAGFAIGHLYYIFLLQHILPSQLHTAVDIGISVFSGLAGALCRQLRCIYLLLIPMYCGKPGRGVLKALVLTYVIAGPITNMGLNAKEVVRVFACSTQLAHNLSKTKYALMAGPFRAAMVDLRAAVPRVNDTFSAFGEVVKPIEREVVDSAETARLQIACDDTDYLIGQERRSQRIEDKYRITETDEENERYHKMYMRKVEYRCQHEVSRAIAACVKTFNDKYDMCRNVLPRYASMLVCWPMKITYICNIVHSIGGDDICDSRMQIDPNIGTGFVSLERAKNEMVHNVNDVTLAYKLNYVRELEYIQDAKGTGELVLHAFEEKVIVMRTVMTIVDIAIAMLFLRLLNTAVTYHDTYLTKIDHDNVYITGYFKEIDRRRREKREYTLLPLKKMERSKYTGVYSSSMVWRTERLLSQGLKVMLEVITATTFVMLDRMFYEALDVVRQHARVTTTQRGTHDLEIKVDGSGLLATMVRKILGGLNSTARVNRTVSNAECLPQPRAMPHVYFLAIYGGYLWILLLLYLNPYTMRLRRLICSSYYPRREKQRILHLYNDILKKRMKMQKTFRRIAMQSVRAYYLSGENLLSLSMKFPQVFGWLRLFPAARMTCLICGETEPAKREKLEDRWESCPSGKCPFVYCGECWREVGRRCLACDPSLAELSDVDSLSEDEQRAY